MDAGLNMATAKNPAASAPPDRLAEYEKLVATIPEVERKGATVPYTSANGNMFSFLAADGSAGLRLPEPARREFMDRFQTSLSMQHGAVMKEYVALPGNLLADTPTLAGYFRQSYEYARSLKPKATTRKK